VPSHEYSARTLEKLYRDHPVREETILARLRDRGKDLQRLAAADLADDPVSDVTDQNHIGGSRAVLGLGRAVQLSERDVVLDLGCGIGGSARLLAARFGCRVDGIDISRQRVREGNHLTALVGLSDRVHLVRADMLRAAVPGRKYDVLWGQSAWTHVVDKERFVHRWVPALKPRGRIAFEDVYVKRPPRSSLERHLLERLERDWHSVLISRPAWKGIFTSAGAAAGRSRDFTSALIRYFRRLDRAANRSVIKVPALERRAWRNAIRAAEDGLIGYVRITAGPRI
jgi:cyclopropane fatty-acyl-phospholipid synthase-like methyltransferase